jgi:hypothetical protein
MTRSSHRRPGARGSRRSGGQRVASAAAFTPASDPLALLWWDPTSPSGAVASWTDKIAGVSAANATGTQQPTQSNTAIGGAHPGVTGDAGDILVAPVGPVVSGKTTLTVIAAMVDTDTATKVAMELTASATANNGGFFIASNSGGAGRLSGGVRGTVGFSERYATEALASVKVVAVGLDFATAGATAVSFIRINGVSQSLTTASSASAAGSATNASLYLFARSGPTLGALVTFGDIVFRESIAEDATLEQHEDFIAARCGLSF